MTTPAVTTGAITRIIYKGYQIRGYIILLTRAIPYRNEPELFDLLVSYMTVISSKNNKARTFLDSGNWYMNIGYDKCYGESWFLKFELKIIRKIRRIFQPTILPCLILL